MGLRKSLKQTPRTAEDDVREIVTKHPGRCQCNSQFGVGSTVRWSPQRGVVGCASCGGVTWEDIGERPDDPWGLSDMSYYSFHNEFD